MTKWVEVPDGVERKVVGRKAGERSDSFHARKTKSFGMVAARRVRLKL